MTLKGRNSADSIEEKVEAINHLHGNLTKYNKMLDGSQLYW